MTKLRGSVIALGSIAITLVVAVSGGTAKSTAGTGFERQGIAIADPVLVDTLRQGVADSWIEREGNRRIADRANEFQIAQFRLPPSGRESRQKDLKKAPIKAPTGVLPLEYVWGLEAELPYSRNLDLDSRIKDDALFLAPTMFGSITYRPNNMLETRLEVTLEKVFAAFEQDPLTLPDGTQQPADRRQFSALIDQLYVKFTPPSSGVEFTVGRRNFEDNRLWLYDAALDAAVLTLKPGDFNIEASVSREDLVDLDLTAFVPTTETNNYIIYSEYRGIEDHKLGAYWIHRNDTSGEEGAPHFLGLRASGRPLDAFNYWAELAYVTGEDENSQTLSAGALDVGGTYRFLKAPLQPSVTLSFAYGTGDGDSTDGTNNEFRQTGLQSNEGRFGGVTQFVTKGEVLTPEISNLKIVTAGVGFRPFASMFVDLVYHQYWLNEIATEIRGQSLTAEMNRFGSSKNVGSEFDVILGFRNLFGIRGLGFETRGGLFFPGDAWRRNDGSDPQMGVTALGVFFF